MNLTLGEIARIFPENTLALPADIVVADFCQDTRKITAGSLYIAIRGEHHDGHDFITDAFAKGAVAALVSRAQPGLANCFLCDDTVQGLGVLAHYYRKKFSQPLIAITGSSGKTTTKELLTHVLSAFAPVVATTGNLNNHIGVPLTLAKFNAAAGFFVVEMGMNHAGEIRYLTKIAEPTVALITNVGVAHIENFNGSSHAVAAAKGELFLELAPTATAIVNNDDEKIRMLSTSAKKITYGIVEPSDVQANNITFSESGTQFILQYQKIAFPVHLQAVGFHHVMNALAVFATSQALHLDADQVVSQLESFAITFNRGRLIHRGSVTIVDDTYNANPASLRVACEALTLQFPQAKKIAVLGGMLELGDDAKAYHHAVGAGAKEVGIDEVFAYGGEADSYLQGFGYTPAEVQKRFFKSHDALAAAVLDALKNHSGKTAVLVKGSRGMKMELALNIITGN